MTEDEIQALDDELNRLANLSGEIADKVHDALAQHGNLDAFAAGRLHLLVTPTGIVLLEVAGEAPGSGSN